MLRRCVAAIFFLSLPVSGAAWAQAKQPTADSDSAVAQALKAIEQDWLNAEKNRDVVAFQKLVADDWVAITPDGKSQT